MRINASMNVVTEITVTNDVLEGINNDIRIAWHKIRTYALAEGLAAPR